MTRSLRHALPLLLCPLLFHCALPTDVTVAGDGKSQSQSLPDGNDTPDDGTGAPRASGCITSTASGDQTFSCQGLSVQARIPAACQAPGCGLILQIHGDTGTGMLMDQHTNLRALGEQNGYIVLSPTGRPHPSGGATWAAADDAKLVSITQLFASVFRVDAKKIHATGFSRGGFVNWRLLCDASDLFASVAPAAAGNGNGETTCFFNGRVPARRADVLFMIGTTDVPVPLATMTAIRDAAIANYQAGPGMAVSQGMGFTQTRWTNPQGAVIETFQHSYETNPNGPWGGARGHCFPGSAMNPFGPQYALPCAPPNAFKWGEEVVKFFKAHPKP